MTKIEEFKAAIEKLHARVGGNVTEEQDEKDAQIMSNPDNWCFVHATRYKPSYDKDGNIVIPSTAMATGDIARNTVHGALNHVVESHKDSSWDDCPYVVFAPYNALVARNGDPVGLVLIDTYFSTDIDTGLVFPKESTYIVHPSDINDTELYTIGEHEAVYKSTDYTDEETKTILSFLSRKKRAEYDRLMAGDLEKYEMYKVLETDTRAKQMYEMAKDKKAFLRGVMADKRDEILASFLRDFVTRKAMETKGFNYVEDALARTNDDKKVAKAVKDIAISKQTDAAGDSHARSFYGVDGIQGEFSGFKGVCDNIRSETNMDDLFAYLLDKPFFFRAVAYNDFQYLDNYYSSYEQKFERHKIIKKGELRSQEKIDNYRGIYNSLQCENIEQFDPNLAKALKRQIEVLTQKLRDWRKVMEQNPKFQKLVKKLQDYDNGNYEDYEQFMKPSIEGIDARTLQSHGRD